MKLSIILLICMLLMGCVFGCSSVGKLYQRGEYTETVCTKRLFKKDVCTKVTKEGLHVTKMITAKGTSAKFAFKDGEETGEGASFFPDFSGLQFKSQN